MRSIARRVRSKSPFRRRKKASELISEIRHVEIDYNNNNNSNSTQYNGEHEQPGETSAIEIVLESPRATVPAPAPPAVAVTPDAPATPPPRNRKDIPSELVDARTMSTASTTGEITTPDHNKSNNSNKRMSFRDRFMNKRGGGATGAGAATGAAASRGRGRSRRRSPEQQQSSSRGTAVLENQNGNSDQGIEVDHHHEQQHRTSGSSSSLLLRTPKIVTRMEQNEPPSPPHHFTRQHSGMSGIPIDDMDNSLFDPPTAGFNYNGQAGQGQGGMMGWSDTPYAVEFNKSNWKRAPVSELTQRGENASVSSSSSSDEEEALQHGDNKQSDNNGDILANPVPLTQARSMGEDSIDNVRRALVRVEEDLKDASRSGKKISRANVAQALFAVADTLESVQERKSMRRQVERLISSEKSGTSGDGNGNGGPAKGETQTQSRAVPNQKQQQQQQQHHQQHQQQQQQTHQRRQGPAQTQVKSRGRGRRDDMDDDSRGSEDESAFTDWVAEIEDDLSFDSRPEPDFFSDMFGFFTSADEKPGKKAAKKREEEEDTSTWHDFSSGQPTSAGFDPRSFDDSDLFSEETNKSPAAPAPPPPPPPPTHPKPTKTAPSRGPSLVVDSTNDYELPPPPHAMRARPLFGVRSTLQTAPQYKPAPSRSERKATTKPSRFKPQLQPAIRRPLSPEPAMRPLAPLPQTEDDNLSLSSIESAQYQDLVYTASSRSRDDSDIHSSAFAVTRVLSDDTSDDGYSSFLRNRRNEMQASSSRQRSKSAHAPRRRQQQGSQLLAV